MRSSTLAHSQPLVEESMLAICHLGPLHKSESIRRYAQASPPKVPHSFEDGRFSVWHLEIGIEGGKRIANKSCLEAGPNLTEG